MRNVLILFTAAVMILSAAGFVMPRSAAAKSRTITIRCVCAGKVVRGATFDVYLGSKRIANDVKYFRKKAKKGKIYKVKDIRPGLSYAYKGKKTVRARMSKKSRTVSITLVRKYKLSIGAAGAGAGKVTFDVTAGGKKRANDVSSYSAKISKGTKWSVSDVRSSDPHVRIEIPVRSGRIGTKAQAVTIKTKLTAHNTSGVERIVKEPTFEEDGSKVMKCSICGKDVEMRTLPKYTGEISFSEPAGAYFAQEIGLGLTSDEGLDIIYTTDGSNPSAGNGKKYEGEITLKGEMNRGFLAELNKNLLELSNTPGGFDMKLSLAGNVPGAAVVRAAAVLDDGTTGPVTTKTFFLRTSVPRDFGCTVVSVTADPAEFFSAESGILALGSMYEENSEYNAQMIEEGTSWLIMANYTQRGKEWERPAYIEIFDGQGEEVYEGGCGIRVQGGSSRRFSQKSFNIYFKKKYGDAFVEYPLIAGSQSASGDEIGRYESFTLRNGGNDADSTKFRNMMMQELLSDIDTDTQRACPAVLFLNGEFFGIYNLNEKYSSFMMAERYGIDEDEIIMVDKKEIEEAADEEEAQAMFDELVSFEERDFRDPTTWEEFSSIMDTESLADFYAARIYIGDPDWDETTMHNCRIWRTASSDGAAPLDGKWRWILYDIDYSCGLYGAEETSPEYDHLARMLASQEYPLFRQLMESAEFRQMLSASLRKVATRMTADRVEAAMAKWITSDMTQALFEKNRLRFGYPLEDNLAFEIQNLKGFFTKRPQMLEQMIREIDEYVM